MTTQDDALARLDAVEQAVKQSRDYGETAKGAVVSSIAADDAALAEIAALRELLSGVEPPVEPPPDGPDLQRGLLYELAAPITAAVDLAPFAEQVVTVSMVVDVEVSDLHQKLFCIEDTLSIGTLPSGPLDIWTYGGEPKALQAMTPPPPFQYLKASWLLVERPAGVLEASVDGALFATQQVATPPADASGRRAALMQGFWKGVAGKDPARGKISHCMVWNRELSAAEITALQALVAPLVEEWPTPPPSPAVSIGDAAPVKPGEIARFALTLDAASEIDIKLVMLIPFLAAPAEFFIDAGQTVQTLEVAVPPGTAPGPFAVTISEADGAAIGRATGNGTVLAVTGGNGGGNGGGGDPGPLEPLDERWYQVTLSADSTRRHTWRGIGYGLNASAPAKVMLPHFKTHVHKLCRDSIGMNVMRILAPENVGTVMDAFWPYYQHLKSIGSAPHWVVGTGFVWRGGITVEKLIDGVAELRRRGLPINVVVAQNEPDGNPANAIAGGTGKYVEYAEKMLARIKHHKMESEVECAGIGEWRHIAGQIDEARILKAAGLLGAGPGKVTQISTHNYDKCASMELADLVGNLGVGSWEDGNNGAPSSLARVLSGANLHDIFAMCHYCMVASPTPGSEPLGQALLDYHGNPRPWYGQRKLAKHLLPGSVIRRVESSDRFSGMPEDMARWMMRDASKSGGWNPRQNMVFALGPDGKTWCLVGLNTTHGADGPNKYTSGHSAALPQQHTFKAAEWAGRKGKLTAYRASIDGKITGPQTYAIDKGQTRYKLGPGEAIVMTGVLQ